MYQIILKKVAQKSLKKIDQRYQSKIRRLIFKLRDNPFLGKRLEGELKEFRSIRAWPHRIVYKIYKQDLVILVIEITHRQGIYK